MLRDVEVKIGPGDPYVLGKLPAGSVVPVIANDSDWLAIPATGWIHYDSSNVDLSQPIASIRGFVLGTMGSGIIGLSHPESFRTGIPVVDRVTDLVQRRDAAGLLAISPSQTIPCKTDESREWPDCEGRPTGTPLSVFLRVTCEGDYIPSAAPAINTMLFLDRDGQPSGKNIFGITPTDMPAIYGVYESMPIDSRTHSAYHAYYIVYTMGKASTPSGRTVGPGWNFSVLVNDEGMITRIGLACGPGSLLSKLPFVIPPVTPPGLIP